MHIDVIHRLLQWVWHLLDDEIISMLEVIGDFFDDISTDIDSVLTQMDLFQSDADGSLPDFERFYRIPVLSGATVAERRSRVIARIRARGPLNYLKMYSIADALGYSIDSGVKYLTVTEGIDRLFRAGYGMAGINQVWNQSTGGSMYDVIVTGTDVETDAELQFLINRLRLQGTNFIFENV